MTRDLLDLAESDTHTAKQPRERSWPGYALTFGIAFLVLFLSADRTLNLYDEGITLTAGLRVLHGQVPYRDFYFIYGPALPYLLAALFRIFGPSVFVAFLFDLTLKSLLCASFFTLVRHYCSRVIAALFTALLIAWIFTLQLEVEAVTPVSLLSLCTIWLMLPVFTRAVAPARFLAVGLLAGLTSLFRPDAGIALLFMVLLLLLVAGVARRWSGQASAPRYVACGIAAIAGFVPLVGAALLAYRAIAPWHGLYFDLLYYPAHYFRVSRGLPLLHRPDLGLIGELTVLLPGATGVLAWWAAFHLWRRRSDPRSAVAPAMGAIGCLCSFGLLAAVMYVKGLVRIDLWENYLALVPTLVLLAVLLQYRAAFGSLFRTVVYALVVFCALATLRFAEHTARVARDQKSLLAAWLIRPRSQAPLPPDTGWCELKSPATEHLCFLVDPDHIHTIEFLLANTRPSDTLYVGLRHHDRVYANDNITYFASGLLPATRWSHMDPHLQNTRAIQLEMIGELASRKPPYVVLDSEFEAFNEPKTARRAPE